MCASLPLKNCSYFAAQNNELCFGNNIMIVVFQACEPAARLALEDVNSNDDLLPGYNLNLHWNDSGVRLLRISLIRSLDICALV